jgi:hypothetical protein
MEAIMPRDVKGPSPTHEHPPSFFSLLSGWVQQGFENFFATQRILVDLAVRQNAAVIKSLREGLSDPKNGPVAILTEVAVEGTANFVEAQRILLNLVQQENEILMNGVKERVGGSMAATAMTDVLRRSVDNFVDMQQKFLTIANKHTQNWLESAKAGKPFVGSQMVEYAREAMSNFVTAQKKFLDVIAEETEKVTSGKHDKTGKKVNATELSKLAREAANALIEAQKSLLDLGGQQMNVNLQAASRAMENMSGAFKMVPVAKLSGEGVRSFVDAEKAMMDSMLKPFEKKPATPKKAHRPRPAARKPKSAPKPSAQVAHA